MPDDPRDTSTTEDSTPNEPASQSPWAARRSLPSVEDVPSGPGVEASPDEAAPRPRSIFNRFRRGRMTPEDLQARLMFAEEQPSKAGADEAPALEPARVPARRPAVDDVTPISQPPASLIQPGPPSPPVTGSRPTPPIEAILPAQMVAPLEPARPAPEPVVAPAAALPPPVTPWIAASSPPAASPAAPPTEAPEVSQDAAAAPEAATPPASVSAPLPPVVASLARPPVETPAAAEPASTPPLVTTSRFEVFEYEERPVAIPAVATVDAESKSSRSWPAFRPIPVPVNPYMLLLSGLASLVMLAYLLVEPSPRGFLILGAAVVAVGLDGTLRATWRVTYAGRETTAALFMPALFILAVPPLIEHNVRGLGVLPAGLTAGLAFFAIVAAQVGSARPNASYYPWARTVSTAGAYAAGFAFFSLTYVYNLGIAAAALATGLVALMLAIEVLREGEIDAIETAGYAAAAGAAVGQWRLALHYLPVDGYLAGLAVLLGFLLVTGLLQAYITRSLDGHATIDHAVVALAGAVLVVGARVAGLA